MSKCDCGCDHEHDNNHNCHEHEHHHDENCDCGCNHEHVHNDANDAELYTEDANSPVVYSLEKSFTLNASISPDELANNYLTKVNLLASWIDEHGGLVGHLKLLISNKANGEELWISCAGASATIKHAPNWLSVNAIDEYNLGFTAIVLGVVEKSLINQIETLFASN